MGTLFEWLRLHLGELACTSKEIPIENKCHNANYPVR